MERIILVGKQNYPDFGENKLSEFITEAECLASDISLSTGINCGVRVVDNSIHSHGHDWSEQVEVVAKTNSRFFLI